MMIASKLYADRPSGMSTWAAKPAASAVPAHSRWLMTDYRAIFISNGTDWYPEGGLVRGGGTAVASPVTGTTDRTSAYSTTLPADMMGLTGELWIWVHFTATNNANAKNPKLKFGSTDVWTASGASLLSAHVPIVIANRNSRTSQIVTSASTAMVGSAASGAASENTANALALDFSFQLASGSDTATLERISWEIRK